MPTNTTKSYIEKGMVVLKKICFKCHDTLYEQKVMLFCRKYIVELQWLEHLWDHENMFETGVVQANEC